MLLSQRSHLVRVTDKDKVCNVLFQHLVCCDESTLLLSLWEDDALLVSLSTRYNLIN